MENPSGVDALTHSHVFLGKSHDANARRTLWVVGLTAAMMVGEIAAGFAYGSMALLADGFHMATHAGALSVAAMAYAYARRHAHNRRFTFGTGKIGELAGFASALVLAVVALGIGVESVGRLLSPHPVNFGNAAVIAAVSFAVNVVSALVLSGGHDHNHDGPDAGVHDHSHHGRRPNRDNNIRSAYIHVLSDALTSVLAILALLGGQFLNWVWLDPAIGIVGSVVIIRWSWTLLRDTGDVLLDTTDPILEHEIKECVELGSTRITDLHVWRVGPEAHAAIVSVVGDADAAIIRDRLKAVRELAHITVEHH